MSIKSLVRKNYFKAINDKGFTLIETIISLVILSIAVTGVLQVFFTGLAPRNAPLSIEITTGTQLVQEGLERVKADRSNPARGFAYIVSANYLPITINGYVRTTTIAPGWGGDVNYTQVTVSVTHNSRTVASATTLVANF
ncbi:MAG: prepilin-type N-terminal cleavage/methylation domain-containing protein [Deltaproteobacteria bacterium]|nr:prepilin-type N-terminal cleavage/methylation domain-containing protein [Deltaproteobacteria bacterium]